MNALILLLVKLLSLCWISESQPNPCYKNSRPNPALEQNNCEILQTVLSSQRDILLLTERVVALEKILGKSTTTTSSLGTPATRKEFSSTQCVAITDFVTSTKFGLSDSECYDVCLFAGNCLSANYDDVTHTCELLDDKRYYMMYIIGITMMWFYMILYTLCASHAF